MNPNIWYVILILIFIIVLLYLFMNYSNPSSQAIPEGYRQVQEASTHKQLDKKAEIVLYYSPGCGHCTMFMPTWDKFQQYASNNLPGLSVKKINCSARENAQICSQPDIPGFPTVIIYPANGQHVSFEKNRTLEDLVSFVNEHSK